MWAAGDGVKIRKGFMSFKKFWKSYKHAVRKIGNSTGIAIHFRIGTSGMLDRRNCHPHRVNEKLAFIHNGILPIEVPPGSTVSDSVLFSELLASLPEGWHMDVKIRLLVEMAMGGRNKICLLDEKGLAVLLNEDAGTWDDDVWFSNMHWDRRQVMEITDVTEGQSGCGWKPTFSEKSWKGYKPTKNSNGVIGVAFRPGAGTKPSSLKFQSVGAVYGAKRRDSQVEKDEDRDAIKPMSENAPSSSSEIADSSLRDKFLETGYEDKSGSSRSSMYGI